MASASNLLPSRSAAAPAVPPSLRDVPLVFVAPACLFRRIEDTGTYGWTLLVLLTLVTLVGYAQVKTGLIDRMVDQQTERNLAELERTQLHLVDRLQFKDAMEAIRKNGEFMKLLRRLGAVVVAPAGMLAGCLLVSSVLYAAVALTGRKPEYHTLMTICVYASFINLAGHVLRLLMMIYYHTLSLDTSLLLLDVDGKMPYLAALDPFSIWFWVLVAIGLAATDQLRRRSAALWCGGLFLVAAAGRTGAAYMMQSAGQPG